MARSASAVDSIQRSAQAQRASTEARKQAAYLRGLARLGTQTAACHAAHVDSRTVHVWREHDETFAMRERESKDAMADVLESEAIRRGVHGVQTPIYQAGKFVGYKVEYSDQLLTLVLRAWRPDKYRERVDLNVPQVIKAIAGISPGDVL